MSNPHDYDSSYPREGAKRVMGRVALVKLSRLVTSWRAEEEQKALLARRVSIAFIAIIVLWLLGTILVVVVLHSHPKIQLFALSILIGVGVGLILVRRNKRQ